MLKWLSPLSVTRYKLAPIARAAHYASVVIAGSIAVLFLATDRDGLPGPTFILLGGSICLTVLLIGRCVRDLLSDE